MNKTDLVRCLGCGTVYDRGKVKDCPQCHAMICDEILIVLTNVQKEMPIVDFKAAMYSYPKIFGLAITSKN